MPKFEVEVTYFVTIEAESVDRVYDAIPSEVYLDFGLGVMNCYDAAEVSKVSE